MTLCLCRVGPATGGGPYHVGHTTSTVFWPRQSAARLNRGRASVGLHGRRPLPLKVQLDLFRSKLADAIDSEHSRREALVDKHFRLSQQVKRISEQAEEDPLSAAAALKSVDVGSRLIPSAALRPARVGGEDPQGASCTTRTSDVPLQAPSQGGPGQDGAVRPAESRGVEGDCSCPGGPYRLLASFCARRRGSRP